MTDTDQAPRDLNQLDSLIDGPKEIALLEDKTITLRPFTFGSVGTARKMGLKMFSGEDKEEVDGTGDDEEPQEEGAAEGKEKASSSSSLPKLADASLEQYSTGSIKNDIEVLEKERDTLAKNANMGAIAEYRKKEADYLSR